MNTRKLILIEYDDQGNEVDRNIILEHGDIINAYKGRFPIVKSRYLLDKNDRELYTSDQWDMIERENTLNLVETWVEETKSKFMYLDFQQFCYAKFNDKLKAFWDVFFVAPKEKQAYILNIYEPRRGEEYFKKGYIPYNSADIVSCWEWVTGTDGIYQVVENDGKLWSTLYDKPTLKQVKYQEKKGRRIVFYSFKDWKTYATNENDFR